MAKAQSGVGMCVRKLQPADNACIAAAIPQGGQLQPIDKVTQALSSFVCSLSVYKVFIASFANYAVYYAILLGHDRKSM